MSPMRSLPDRFRSTSISRRVAVALVTLLILGATSGVRAGLTPEEQAFSQGLDAAAQANYAATREFVHRSAAVVAKTFDAAKLGRRPPGFDAQYLRDGEAAMLTEARNLSNIALINGIKFTAPPAAPGLPPARGDLTPEELTVAKGMNPDDRQKYEATRAYAHRATAIVARTAAPTSLGSKPKAFDARYLLDGEANTISQARDLSNIELMRGLNITK
jgi:hypothetical protein